MSIQGFHDGEDKIDWRTWSDRSRDARLVGVWGSIERSFVSLPFTTDSLTQRKQSFAYQGQGIKPTQVHISQSDGGAPVQRAQGKGWTRLLS